jgi:hypothetical protein
MSSWLAWACLAGWLLVGVQQYRIVSIEAERASERAEISEATSKAVQAARDEEQRRIAEQSKHVEVAHVEQKQIVVDDRVSADAFERLRVRYEAANARATQCGNTISQSLGQTAEHSARMQADMLERLGAAVRLYAATADSRGVAGRLCEASYDALSHRPN